MNTWKCVHCLIGDITHTVSIRKPSLVLIIELVNIGQWHVRVTDKNVMDLKSRCFPTRVTYGESDYELIGIVYNVDNKHFFSHVERNGL
jgi:hypothetical protein